MGNRNTENKNTGISDKQKTRVRVAIYSMAGVYLIYNAYCMYREISVTSGNQHTLMIVFSILYAVLGAALSIFALVMAYKMGKDKKVEDQSLTDEDLEEANPEDENLTEDIQTDESQAE